MKDLYVLTLVALPTQTIDNIVDEIQSSYASNTCLSFLIGDRKRIVLQSRVEDTLTIKDIVIPAQCTSPHYAEIDSEITYAFINKLKGGNRLDTFMGVLLYEGSKKSSKNDLFLTSLINLRKITNQNLIGIITNERDETITMKYTGESWLYSQNF